MKKRTHLHTNFVKFIIEKIKKDIQELPDEKEKKSNTKLTDEFDEIIDGKNLVKKKSNEDESQDDNEDIDTLLKEYLKLEKKYNSKRNDSIFKR